MKYLGLTIAELKAKNANLTAVEIAQQPKLWLKIYQEIVDRKSEISHFLEDIDSNDQVILTGAGSSSFIGEALESVYIQQFNSNTRAVPTTTILTHPETYFSQERPTLLISFARSGNSPESRAVMALANQLCGEIKHLVITCNEHGQMIKEIETGRDFVLLLPKEADDQSLAMTGSFTGMMFAAYLLTQTLHIETLRTQVEHWTKQGEKLIREDYSIFKSLADQDFKRAIFLGSGPLLGIARESHLKVQELTNGRVMCNYDSYLGLRHGPKVVVDSDTLVVYLRSEDGYIVQYERDLIQDLMSQKLGKIHLAVGSGFDLAPSFDFECRIDKVENPILFAIFAVLPAQLLGFYKSLQLGLHPDRPSVNGAISRVVKGVMVYEYHRNQGKPSPLQIG